MEKLVSIFLLLAILMLAISLSKSVKERISPDPWRAAFMEMAAAKSDPLSRYLYSFGPEK